MEKDAFWWKAVEFNGFIALLELLRASAAVGCMVAAAAWVVVVPWVALVVRSPVVVVRSPVVVVHSLVVPLAVGRSSAWWC